jgi:nucleoside-diphosphate kinase
VALERTLCIIKPDAVAANHQGAILQSILESGFSVLAMRQAQLSPVDGARFYAVHKARPFFAELVEFICSGPVVLAALCGEDAVAKYRTLIGATDPTQAAEGTIRKRFGAELARNAVHGSDSVENGLRETAFFFSGAELGVELD